KGRPRRPGMGCRPQSAGHNIRRALRRLNVSENRMGPLRYTEDQTLPGASVRSLDELTMIRLQPFWHEVFADGTVLPDDPNRPIFWDDATHDRRFSSFNPTSPFANAWRAWAAKAHPDVVIAPDWRAGPDAD
ncbi:MAG: hypothetical protein NXH79_06485, partial [Rhodobacteraceae bacterium]|nr:hypothetical protein [Paracoccaceae bacterium]